MQQICYSQKLQENTQVYQSISRPSRFFDTIQRIVGPTKPSLQGEAKLPLASYRRRVWELRIRNKGKFVRICTKLKLFLGSTCPELIEHGLSLVEKLQLGENVDCLWKLSGTPMIGFYQIYLTQHLKLPKVIIGRLLLTIIFKRRGAEQTMLIGLWIILYLLQDSQMS